MATYRFINYQTDLGVLNGDFTNPTITVDQRSIITDDIDKTITCNITMTGTDYEVSTQLLDIPRNGATGWDDSDLTTMINTKMQDFLVE